MTPQISLARSLAVAATAAGLFVLPWMSKASSDAPTEAPQTGRPVHSSTPTESESLAAPDGPVYAEPELMTNDASSLETKSVAPGTPGDRAGLETNGASLLLPGMTTPAEQIKLDLARAAVERARLAGTLEVRTLPEDVVDLTPAEIEAMKLQKLHALPVVTPAEDPIAGVGDNLPSIQEAGPAGLSDLEEAKLRGEIPPQTAPQTPATRDADREGDGADAKKPQATTPNAATAIDEEESVRE